MLVPNDIKDQESKSINDCWQRNDWLKWKDIIEVELDSLIKWKVFGPIVCILEGVRPIRYKWTFMQK